jgi:putative membrane protein
MFGCGRSGMIILAAAAAVAFVVVAFLGFGSFNPYYGGYYSMMSGFGGLGALFMLPVVLVVVAVVGYFLWRICGGLGMRNGGGCCGGSHYGHYSSYQSRDDALSILRQRYARGEISREQFEQMRKDIDSQ